MNYLKKEELEDMCVYYCDARNFNIGIWFNGTMHGLRRKFGDEYIDEEIHYDDDPHFGTCKPLKKLSNSLKDRIEPYMFEIKNWRGQCVLHDMLFAIEAVMDNFKLEEEDNA